MPRSSMSWLSRMGTWGAAAGLLEPPSKGLVTLGVLGTLIELASAAGALYVGNGGIFSVTGAAVATLGIKDGVAIGASPADAGAACMAGIGSMPSNRGCAAWAGP